MEQLVNFAHKKISERPDLRNQIIEIVDIATNNIEDGKSSKSEIDLAYKAIENLISPPIEE